jgi:HxlR-like helix-turn-helix
MRRAGWCLARTVTDGLVRRLWNQAGCLGAPALDAITKTRPERFDYILTDKGWQLCDILLAVSAWGDKWKMAEAGPPALIRHRPCDHLTIAEIRCSHCGEPLHATDAEVTPLR